jgi:sec-independent protein translocase protein TatC
MSVRPPEEELESELSGHMSFLDHLEELRTRILRSLIATAVTFVACWAFVNDIFRIVSAPILTALEASGEEGGLIFLNPTQPFSLLLKTAFIAAIFLASPFIMAQVWLFITPGLYRHERRYAIPFILSGTVLAFVGALFGYIIAFPFALEFLIGFGQSAGMRPMIDGTQYVNLFLTIELGLGIVFQIPPIIFVLSRMGLVSPGFLLRNTKYAVLISFVVAAIITPTADIPNMMIMAGPMIILYLVGVLVAFVFGKKRRKPDE